MQPSPPAEVEAALSQLRAACAHWPIGDGSGAFYVAQNGASPGVACLAASDDFVPHVAVTAASFATVFLLFVIVLTVLADRWIARRKMLDAGIALAVFCLVMLAFAAAAASLWGGSTTLFVAWLLEDPSSGGLQLFLIFAIGGAVFFWLAWRCCNRIGDLVTGLRALAQPKPGGIW